MTREKLLDLPDSLVAEYLTPDKTNPGFVMDGVVIENRGKYAFGKIGTTLPKPGDMLVYDHRGPEVSFISNNAKEKITIIPPPKEPKDEPQPKPRITITKQTPFQTGLSLTTDFEPDTG